MKRNKSNKDQVITVRCTAAEKKKISLKAEKLKMSEAAYIIGCSISGLDKISTNIKKMTVNYIEMIERNNQISYLLDCNNLEKNDSNLLIDKVRKYICQDL